jgi:hypothetical protein
VVLGIQSNECGDTCAGRRQDRRTSISVGNAVGNMVTGFKVRGGWSENSMKFIQEKGVPEVAYWPEGDNKRHWDSPDTWANAAENVVL